MGIIKFFKDIKKCKDELSKLKERADKLEEEIFDLKVKLLNYEESAGVNLSQDMINEWYNGKVETEDSKV